ncbi:hypothetical protein SUGI_0422400 [Cryptomeria japonica]|nr:hypothetical protein SUGI_0422400 [Cryptomeria japonica]
MRAKGGVRARVSGETDGEVEDEDESEGGSVCKVSGETDGGREDGDDVGESGRGKRWSRLTFGSLVVVRASMGFSMVDGAFSFGQELVASIFAWVEDEVVAFRSGCELPLVSLLVSSLIRVSYAPPPCFLGSLYEVVSYPIVLERLLVCCVVNGLAGLSICSPFCLLEVTLFPIEVENRWRDGVRELFGFFCSCYWWRLPIQMLLGFFSDGFGFSFFY